MNVMGEIAGHHATTFYHMMQLDATSLQSFIFFYNLPINAFEDDVGYLTH